MDKRIRYKRLSKKIAKRRRQKEVHKRTANTLAHIMIAKNDSKNNARFLWK